MDVEVDWDVTSVRLSKWCLWWCEIFDSVPDRWADMILAVLGFPEFYGDAEDKLGRGCMVQQRYGGGDSANAK